MSDYIPRNNALNYVSISLCPIPIWQYRRVQTPNNISKRNIFFMMKLSNGSIFRVTGPVWREFTGHRYVPLTVTRSFGVLFDLRLNKGLSKHSWAWWLETTSCSLWRHCNVTNVIVPAKAFVGFINLRGRFCSTKQNTSEPCQYFMGCIVCIMRLGRGGVEVNIKFIIYSMKTERQTGKESSHIMFRRTNIWFKHMYFSTIGHQLHNYHSPLVKNEYLVSIYIAV